MMGGTITAESEKGKGSKFTVALRFRTAGEPEKFRKPEHPAGLKALVVDNDEDTCISISRMLSAIGMNPDWTTMGKEAGEAGVTAFCSKPLFLSELRSVPETPGMERERRKETDISTLRFDGKRLLLVDDIELNREVARSIPEDIGIRIDEAEDGSEAVKRVIEKPAGTYDLILMDIQMPVMDGIRATKAIREPDDPVRANIPIVALTANVFGEEEQKETGMSGYVSKPIDMEQLVRTLEDFWK